MRWPTRALLLVLALAAPLSVASAQGGDDLPSARDRWEQMSHEERAEMRRRFEALQRMSPEERRELERRAKKVRELERAARERLPEEVRTELDSLGPIKRREIVRELTEQEVDRRGRDLLGRLSPELREKLQRATPEERRRMLRELEARRSGPGMSRVFDRIGERLGLSPEEVQRLKSLPPEERERALVRLTERIHGGERGKERGTMREELERRMEADPAWRLELSRLSPQERRAAIQQRSRERVLDFLEQRGVPEEELERLGRLEGREFFEAARQHGRERPAGSRPTSRPEDRPGDGRARPGRRPEGQPQGRSGEDGSGTPERPGRGGARRPDRGGGDAGRGGADRRNRQVI